MRRLTILGCVFVISLLIIGCQPSAEKETFVPFENIVVEEGTEAGIATLDSLKEKASLEVKGLPALDDKNIYEAWLVDKDINLKISIGTFNVDKDGNYELNADVVKDDILDTDFVIVTLEPVPDTDSGPSDKIVLQGETGGTADVMSVKLFAAEEEKEAEATTTTTLEEKKTTMTIKEAEEKPEAAEEEEPEKTEETTTTVAPEATTTTTIKEEAKEKEDTVVIVIKETEKVSLKTTANDPDADKLTYAYTSPLNANGEWQTAYGNAGEYTVTVTVSDGKLSASRDVLIIVNKKEEQPVINEYNPAESKIAASENSQIEFSAGASDVNKDELKYLWKLDGKEISTAKTAKYDISYNDAGAHAVKLEVTDGVSTVGKEWEINVKNVNRKPVLEQIPAINIKETETVKIEPKATDPDEDKLTFTISEPVGDDGEWTTTYDDAGEYNVVVTVSDGADSATQEVKITAENVNRAPVIGEITNKG